MKAGQLDRRIAIQRRVVTQDAYGEENEGEDAWSSLAERWASYRPIDGSERFAAEQFVAREQVEFLVRWDSSLADVTPRDRVVYPIAAPAPEAHVYDIMAVHELGRREGLRLRTARRA